MALDFNIGGTTDDVVNHGSASQLDNLFSAGGSIAVWIYARSWGTAGGGHIFNKGNSPGSGWHLQLNNFTATQSFTFHRDWSTTDGRWDGPNNSLSLNAFHHIGVSYSTTSTANDPSFYVDGQPVAASETSTPAGSPVSDAANNLRVGDRTSADRGFEGLIFAVRQWRRILSAAEFLSIYQQRGADLDNPNEVLRAPYAELGPGSVAPATAGFAKDLTLLPNPGTISGGAAFPLYIGDPNLTRRRTL